MFIKVGNKLINLDNVTIIDVAAKASRYNYDTEEYEQVSNCVRFTFQGAISIEFINEEADVARQQLKHQMDAYLI